MSTLFLFPSSLCEYTYPLPTTNLKANEGEYVIWISAIYIGHWSLVCYYTFVDSWFGLYLALAMGRPLQSNPS